MSERDELGRPMIDRSYLDAAIGFGLRRAQLAIFREIGSAFSGLAVTPAQFSALSVISDNPGISQAELALALDIDRPRVVPMIDALEARGWTHRMTDPADRRVRRLHLTAAGEAALVDLKTRFARHEARLVDRLGSERAQQLIGALHILADTGS